MGFKPVNKYPPPRPRRDATTTACLAPAEPVAASNGSAIEKLFAFADKILSR
jgi:hypothetical protein